MTARIRIGTASWTEQSLVDSGAYYPLEARTAEERLRFYARDFPLVEVDSTYYALPSERNAVLWVERTPDDFLFDVKAFRLFTGHGASVRAFPADIRAELPGPLVNKENLYYRDIPHSLRDSLWRRFEEALSPLQAAGKLGVIVFQFPFWFMPKEENQRHIQECQARLPTYNIAVEFRNRYWFSPESRERTFSFLRRNNISYIVVDEPQGFKSSVPPIADITGPYGIVRFHGRNREAWEVKGLGSSAERFDYAYSPAELAEWIPKARWMAENAREVHLVMNTNRGNQGIVNAQLLASLLGEGCATRPEIMARAAIG